MDQEFSESGQPIYRHKEAKEWTSPHEYGQNLEEISEHISRHIGEVDLVWHEMLSDKVHIDVHMVKPTAERPWYTLVTSGMSDLPMNAPEGLEEFRFAELVICLPPNWDMKQESWSDERHYWPIRGLKSLARFPHNYNTWLWWGHTVPNGDPPEPFASDCAFNTFVLAEPQTVPPEFLSLEISPEKTIWFFAIYPLYKEEVDLKLKKGADKLFERFGRVGLTEIVDTRRKNVAKKLLGLF